MLIGKPRPQGYAQIVDRLTGQTLKECDTYTCVRCTKIIHVPPGVPFEQVATIDRNSNGVMCARHADEDDRRTFIQRVEPQEDIDARLNVFRRLNL